LNPYVRTLLFAAVAIPSGVLLLHPPENALTAIRRPHFTDISSLCAVIETAPGEELRVDYGTGPMVRDPHSGKYRRTRLFVLTLGYSRKSSDRREAAEILDRALAAITSAERDGVDILVTLP
jgi:hypothetical protein